MFAFAQSHVSFFPFLCLPNFSPTLRLLRNFAAFPVLGRQPWAISCSPNPFGNPNVIHQMEADAAMGAFWVSPRFRLGLRHLIRSCWAPGHGTVVIQSAGSSTDENFPHAVDHHPHQTSAISLTTIDSRLLPRAKMSAASTVFRPCKAGELAWRMPMPPS